MGPAGALPADVLRGVETLLHASFGRAVRVTAARPLGGGCINSGARLETDCARSFFLKWNAHAPREMFEAEAEGLSALRAPAAAHGLCVPEVIGVGGSGVGEHRWLLLEYVEPGPGRRDWGETLGRGLAGVHGDVARACAGRYGWQRDNFIGSLRQSNPHGDRWANFWRDQRLAPQVSLARDRGRLPGEDAKLLARLLARTDEALAGTERDGPSLLHGDLWSGNVYASAAGEPVLIDPAVYAGHREVDLAMSELFGGFPAGFLDAYQEALPLHEGYRRVRRPIYQLYYLLVHVNLFGESYLGGVRAAARKVLSELSS